MRTRSFFLSACIVILSLFSARAEAQQGYLVPAEGQYHDALSVVNLLLEEDFPIYQLADDLQVGGTTYKIGDYIVSLPDSGDALLDAIAAAFADDLMDEYGLARDPLPSSFSTQAYRLGESNVTVYFGFGTSGGALWHINPAVNVHFDVGIVTTADVQANDFAGGNAITFPSGGFYIGYLETTGNTNVQNFVAAGGGLLGTCGGGVYGVQAGLLDVDLDLAPSGYPKAADLRGHMVLSNEAPSHQVMHSLGSTYEPSYWVGQNYVNIGPSVTVLARYQSLGADVVPYDPALSRAYGFYPNVDVIEDFWGRPGTIAGKYGSGKVVLSGAHAEYYQTSEIFHLNTLQHLGSEDAAALDDTSLDALPGIRVYQTVGSTAWDPNSATTVPELLYLLGKMVEARSYLNGLEIDNELITDAAGEFLQVFLDDHVTRLPTLIGDAFELTTLYWELWLLDGVLYLQQNNIPADLYQTANSRIAASQSRIVAALDQLGGVDAYNTMAQEVVDEMVEHRANLEEVLAIQASEGETLEFYEKVIDLFLAEAATRNKLHDQSETFILKASFATDAAIENAQGTARLVSAILHSV